MNQSFSSTDNRELKKRLSCSEDTHSLMAILSDELYRLDDNKKKEFLLNKNFIKILKKVSEGKNLNFGIINKLFDNKEVYYDVLTEYFSQNIIDDLGLCNFKQEECLLWIKYVPTILSSKVDMELITILINRGYKLEKLYLVNKLHTGIFSSYSYQYISLKIIELFISECYFFPSCHAKEIVLALKVYSVIYKGKIFNANAFNLALNIYCCYKDKFQSFSEKSLELILPSLIKLYFNEKTEKSINLERQNIYLDRIFFNDLFECKDIKSLKRIIFDYFLVNKINNYDLSVFDKIFPLEMENYASLISTICNINKSNDVEKIRKLAIELYKNPSTYLDVIRLSYNINSVFENEINHRLLKVNPKDKIKVLDGQNFNMLVHVVNGFGTHGDYCNLNDSEGSKQICLSGITDLSIGLISYENKVILGFDHVENNSLLGMSYCDIGSHYNGYFFENKNVYFADFRKTSLMTCYYNEYDFKRSQVNCPSYVVAINQIEEKDELAAQKLDVPIVLIKERKYIERNMLIANKLLEKIKNGRMDLIAFYIMMLIQINFTFGYRNYINLNLEQKFQEIIGIMQSYNVNDEKLFDFLNRWRVPFGSSDWSNAVESLKLIKK